MHCPVYASKRKTVGNKVQVMRSWNVTGLIFIFIYVIVIDIYSVFEKKETASKERVQRY